MKKVIFQYKLNEIIWFYETKSLFGLRFWKKILRKKNAGKNLTNIKKWNEMLFDVLNFFVSCKINVRYVKLSLIDFEIEIFFF